MLARSRKEAGTMPRKRAGYDAACYYDGKLLGRCTKADSDAYTLLMNACGGEAARVLREYVYFSPELRAILENAALMQADRSRTGGMFHAPKSSPWGEVQNCETLCPGVFLVSTASHGGTMVANEVAAVLSPAAKKCGFKDKGYICYEEDAQESVVLRELLDKNGYILHIDLAPVKELISLQRRCSNNLNQVAIHAHTYGVYPEEIDGLKRDYEKLWGEVSKVLRELSELVAK
ncbi:MobC family plasmid mobilization relaxosome protein [Gemmiger formicilis]|nr:MobC family plasmid mobilization relaxosome protein [Gemmiger formicilis]MCC2192994.1 MobC family plasmid mobilization relaxosome protein [Gemmiger formicilis]